MQYVPRSHTHGVFPIVADPKWPVHHTPQPPPGAPDPRGSRVKVPVRAGSVIFHHGNLLHGSGSSRTVGGSGAWRRAVVLHFSVAHALATQDKVGLNEQVSMDEQALLAEEAAQQRPAL